MAATIRFPQRGVPVGQRGIVVGLIETDAVAPLASTCTAAAQTNGGTVSITLPTTTLSAPAAVGATSVTLTSTVGYANGSVIRVVGAGQGGTSLGGGDLIAEITLAGNVASLFEPGMGVPLAVQTAVAANAVVAPGFKMGDYLRIAGGGAAGADLDTCIITATPLTGNFGIAGRPGLPTAVAGAAITQHYQVETRQIARRVTLERHGATPQIDEWTLNMGLGEGKRTASDGAISYVNSGGLIVLATRIIIPFDLLPASSAFTLTLHT